MNSSGSRRKFANVHRSETVASLTHGDCFSLGDLGASAPVERCWLLEQSQSSTRLAYDLALGSTQIYKFKSVAVVRSIAHNCANPHRAARNWHRKFQMDRCTNIPSGNKYSRDSDFADIKSATLHHSSLFHFPDGRPQFSFEFIPLESPRVYRGLVFFRAVHRQELSTPQSRP